MKPRILILSHSLELGGAERSLIGLLSALSAQKIDIDFFLLRHEGEFMDQIPPYINLLPEMSSYTVLARPMKNTLKEGHLLLTGARILGKIKAVHYDKTHHYTESGVALEYSHKYTWKLMPKIEPYIRYDLAISFLTPHYIVANKVNARRKIAWIHTDYKKVQIDVKSEYRMWSKYDRIISISESVTSSFVKMFPQLSNKILLIENILPEHLVFKQANEMDVSAEMPRDGSIRLLSIGRYCYAKNFDNVPEICFRLFQRGIDIKWYIIGFGPDETLIREKIRQWKMDGRVILLGKRENPYPYIKECDVYVQPSRYEGKSVTVREAQMLGKPVVITRFPTSYSQLSDGYDGIIVSLDNVECAEEIYQILQNKKLMQSLVDNTKKKNYSNVDEIEKIYNLI